LPVDFSYYDILGVERSATSDEIKAAYHAAVLKYHPDVNTAPNAQRLTAMLNDAYEILSDPERRRAYDRDLTTGTHATEPGESPDEVWDLFTCDRCGKVDPHLRFAMFFRVWSLILFTRMNGAGGVLCPSCRSWFASMTALFSAFLGPWGFPWGLIYTGRALIAAARGGELKRLENAQLLRHLGLAFVQRGYWDESRTAFNDSLRFERNPAVISMLQEPAYANASLLPQPGWLRGQTVGVLSFAIPIVLLVVIFNVIGASDQSTAPNSSTGLTTTASDAGGATTTEATPAPEQTRSPCLDRSIRLKGIGLYNECKKARSGYASRLAAAQTQADKDDYRVLGAMAEINEAIGAADANRDDAKSLAREAIATFTAMKEKAQEPKARRMAQRYYDCYVLDRCSK